VARARLERTLRFQAQHHYRLPNHTEEENRELFGELVDSHHHDWAVTFVLHGEMEPLTGFSVDLAALDAVIVELTSGWDGGDLNSVIPEVAAGAMLPSCEALACWLFERAEEMTPGSATLIEVRVAESDALTASFPSHAPA